MNTDQLTEHLSGVSVDFRVAIRMSDGTRVGEYKLSVNGWRYLDLNINQWVPLEPYAVPAERAIAEVVCERLGESTQTVEDSRITVTLSPTGAVLAPIPTGARPATERDFLVLCDAPAGTAVMLMSPYEDTPASIYVYGGGTYWFNAYGVGHRARTLAELTNFATREGLALLTPTWSTPTPEVD